MDDDVDGSDQDLIDGNGSVADYAQSGAAANYTQSQTPYDTVDNGLVASNANGSVSTQPNWLSGIQGLAGQVAGYAGTAAGVAGAVNGVLNGVPVASPVNPGAQPGPQGTVVAVAPSSPNLMLYVIGGLVAIVAGWFFFFRKKAA